MRVPLGLGLAAGALVLAVRSGYFFVYAATHLGQYDQAAAWNALARAGDVLVLLVVLAVAAGIGRLLLRDRDLGGASLLYVPAVGLGLLGLAGLGLGLAGALTLRGVAAVLGLCAVAGWCHGARWLAAVGGKIRDGLAVCGTPGEAALAAALTIPFLATLVTALAPPIDWDSLAYHLALPKLYASAGRLVPLEWNLYAPWPALMEMLYTLALLLRGDRVAQLLHWAALAGCAAGIAALARREGGRTGALIGAALFLSLPTVVHIGGTCHSDLGLAACVVLAVLAKLDGRPGLAGFLLGMGAGCKVHGLLYLLPIGVWVGFGSGWRAAWRFTAGAAVALLPWVFKTPGDWAGGLDSGLALWLERAKKFDALAENLSLPAGAWVVNLLRLPWLVIVEPWRFVMEALPISPRWSLLGIGLVAAGAVWRRPEGVDREVGRSTRLPVLALWLLVGLEVVLWGAWQKMLLRYLLPALAIACALTGARAGAVLGTGARRAGSGPGRVLVAAGCLVALLPLASVSVRDALFPVVGPSPSGGRGHEARYLEYMFAPWPAFAFMNAALPPFAKVLLFQESRGYYGDRPYLLGDPRTHAAVDYGRLTGPDDLRRRLRALGITHVLRNPANPLYQPRPDHYSPRILGMMDELLRRHGRPLFVGGGVEVHALR